MKEYVGQCSVCGRDIYCEDGFLNGFTDSEGRLSCYDEKHAEKEHVENERTNNERTNNERTSSERPS